MGSSVLKFGSRKLNKENWNVFHPNGTHMYTCGENKVKWYMSRFLAHICGDKSIMFNFIPNGDWTKDAAEFYRSIRIPQCVVTGMNYDLQRHHIVPYCYRSYLPTRYKSRSHHDVVLINDKQHMAYERKATEFKKYISEYYNIPTIGELNKLYIAEMKQNATEFSGIVKEISILLKLGSNLDNDNKIRRIKHLSEITNIDYDVMIEFNYIQFLKLLLLVKKDHLKRSNSFKRLNKYKYDHGYHVMQKLDSEEKIDEFIKMWRNHFIDTMNPQFMPTGWSVDFNHNEE